MRKTIQVFFVKIFLLICLLFVVDQLLGKLLSKFFFSAQHGYIHQLNYVMNDMYDDMLVFGSSRAVHHYVPEVLSDSNVTAFNCGSDGKNIYYHYALLCRISERYVPQVVVLDIIADDFRVGRKDVADNMKSLYPYYSINENLDELIDRGSVVEKIKLNSLLYRYNSKLSEIISDNFMNKDSNWNLGYIPLHGIGHGSPMNHGLSPVDTSKITCLERFINLALAKNIKLILCISPAYGQSSEEFEPIAQIANKYQVPLFNHLLDSTYVDHKEWFKDYYHLNDDGARIYSANIVQEIKALPIKRLK